MADRPYDAALATRNLHREVGSACRREHEQVEQLMWNSGSQIRETSCPDARTRSRQPLSRPRKIPAPFAVQQIAALT